MWLLRFRSVSTPLLVSLVCALALTTTAGCASKAPSNAPSAPTGPAGPQPAEPSLSTGPQPTGPQPTDPQPTEPQPTGLRPTGRQPTGPEPTARHTATATVPSKGINVIAWILDLGVAAPPGAEQSLYAAHQLLARAGRGSCDDVLKDDGVRSLAEDGRLVAAAAQACLAAFGGSDELWQQAKDARDVVNKAGGVNSLNCLDASAFVLLDQLVSKYEANPGGKFESRPGGAQEASSCPRIKSLNPSNGNPDQDVTIEVANPGQVVAVKVRTGLGEPLGYYPWTANGTKLEFKIPADPQGNNKKVCVTLLARPGEWDWEVMGKEFTYTDSASEVPDGFSCLGR